MNATLQRGWKFPWLFLVLSTEKEYSQIFGRYPRGNGQGWEKTNQEPEGRMGGTVFDYPPKHSLIRKTISW